MVKVSADSTCDLSEELIEKYNIIIQPLHILKGSEEFLDGIDIMPTDIFAYFNETGNLCKTAAVSVADYVELFSRLTSDGSELVHVTISSEMSACYQNACIAAKDFNGVYVVDSRNLSTGIGHIVIESAKLAMSGMSAAMIHERMQELTKYVEASFIIDKLDYLKKGGRCSAVAALGANLLKLKPCIEVKNGVMAVGKKYRGSFEKVLSEYVADKLARRDDLLEDRIFVTYASGTSKEAVQMAYDAVLRNANFKQVEKTYAGCSISSHCGPVCLGVLYIRKPE
ncbi:MAG: DegV family protein [Clostridia bacterium]|nr:DegV family protein [Clostridia bacterium]